MTYCQHSSGQYCRRVRALFHILCHVQANDQQERTHNLQVTQEPFPFLRLPGEIRNKIYRLLLLTKNVATTTSNANPICETLDRVADDVTSVRSDEMVIGSIRCKSWRKYTLAYQVALLRVNHQIYCEARGIFHAENFWTLVLVNKANFGKEMKECGFPVLPVSDLCRRMRFFVMGIAVKFPILQNQTDTLLVATAHFKQLVRALWTANGASEMEVKICIQPQRTNNSPCEHCLLRPFFNLRSIKRFVVFDGSEHEYINELACAITTTDGVDQTFKELTESLECLQRYIKAERWTHAVAQATKHSIIFQDCKIVYGNCLLGDGRNIDLSASVAREKRSKEIRLATAIALAEVTLYLGQYASTVEFADCAFDLAVLASFFHPRSFFFDDEWRGSIFLIHARAYMGMQDGLLALCNLDCARDLMPNSVAVASAFQTWQFMFGSSSFYSSLFSPPPSPSFPPSPPTTSTSSAFAPVLGAADDVDVNNLDIGGISLEG